MIIHGIPKWQPSDDLPDIWLDATNTSTGSLKDSGGSAITNNATVGHWISQGGSAFDLVQWGANNRPTWVTNGIVGKASVKFVSASSQILALVTPGGMTSMTGISVLMVYQRASTPGGGSLAFGLMTPHESGNADTTLVYCAADDFSLGGRRLQADSFQAGNSGSMTNGVPGLFAGTLDWSNAKTTFLRNGKVVTRSASFQTSGTTAAIAPHAIMVGGFAFESGTATGSNFDGFISEILVYKNRVLTADEMCVRAAYLAVKWNPNPPVF